MNNISVGTIFGIPVKINPSWFLILALVTLNYGGDFARFPQLNGITPWLLGLITALLLFISVLAHELGHSLVAMSQGIKVREITLFLFGGLANLEEESKTPLQQFLIAIAGPFVSFLIWGILTISGGIFELSLPLNAIIYTTASVNLILAIFNLIPGLPLDGGNILKAIVWQITGNANRGVIFASRVGQLFGWVGVIAGILGILNILPVGNFWTLLIGWFLLQNAGNSAQFATVQETLEQYKAEDAVIADSPIISGDLTLRELANNYIIGQNKWQRFLVTDENGNLLGAINVNDLKLINTSDWNITSVKELTKPIPSTSIINSNQSLLEAAKQLEIMGLKELAVVSENQGLIGLLEKTSILSFLQQKKVTWANDTNI